MQYRKTSPFMLSGGERKRVALASILAWDPEVIILDEPTIGQDYHQKERLRQFIVQLNTQGKTVIMVTHDISEAIFLADRVLAISPQPGKIRLDLDVNIPRPRQDSDRYSTEFVSLTHKLRDALREWTKDWKQKLPVNLAGSFYFKLS